MKLRIVKPKARRFHILRNFFHVAQKSHTCDYCHVNIFPGDYYKGTVIATTYHILVHRIHETPKCPVDPYKVEEEIMRDAEKHSEREMSHTQSVA